MLRWAGYRERSRWCNQERVAMAQRLERMGLSPDDLARLYGFAREQGRTPGALFAYWIDHPEILLARLRELSIRLNPVRQRGDANAIVEGLAKRMRIV